MSEEEEREREVYVYVDFLYSIYEIFLYIHIHLFSMPRGSYAQGIKEQHIRAILAAIHAAKPYADIKALKAEAFDKLGISPKTTQRYLLELEEMGKISLNLDENIAKSEEN